MLTEQPVMGFYSLGNYIFKKLISIIQSYDIKMIYRL